MNLVPRLFALLSILALTLNGCSGLLRSDEPADSIWWLEPVIIPAAGRDSPQDLVLNLSVVPGLDTDRIMNLSTDHRLNHYAGAHWPDDLPEVLTSIVRRSLEQTGDWRVRVGNYARPGECLLTLEVQSFFGRIDPDGVTRDTQGSLNGFLQCESERTEIRVSHSEPVAEHRLSDINRAFQATLQALLNQTLTL